MQTVKIVDAVFTFKNTELIKMLKKRGKFIKYNMNRELAQIDIQIQNYLRN